MIADLREAIARALCDAQQPPGAWEQNQDDQYRNIFRDEADAALSAIRENGCVVVPVETFDTVKRIVSYRTSATGLGRANSEEYRKGCNDMGDWIKREVLDALIRQPLRGEAMSDRDAHEALAEKVALELYNRWREARGMMPVDYIGASHTRECAAFREDARAILAIVAEAVKERSENGCDYGMECCIGSVEELLSPSPLTPGDGG